MVWNMAIWYYIFIIVDMWSSFWIEIPLITDRELINFSLVHKDVIQRACKTHIWANKLKLNARWIIFCMDFFLARIEILWNHNL